MSRLLLTVAIILALIFTHNHPNPIFYSYGTPIQTLNGGVVVGEHTGVEIWGNPGVFYQ